MDSTLSPHVTLDRFQVHSKSNNLILFACNSSRGRYLLANKPNRCFYIGKGVCDTYRRLNKDINPDRFNGFAECAKKTKRNCREKHTNLEAPPGWTANIWPYEFRNKMNRNIIYIYIPLLYGNGFTFQDDLSRQEQSAGVVECWSAGENEPKMRFSTKTEPNKSLRAGSSGGRVPGGSRFYDNQKKSCLTSWLNDWVTD